jgi:hypothetical protein
MYSTPNSSSLGISAGPTLKVPRSSHIYTGMEPSSNQVIGREKTYALAILILVSKVKKALANCSPSLFRQLIFPPYSMFRYILTSKSGFNDLTIVSPMLT